MNILVTNDDGINAPGIQALEQALQKAGHQTITIAPMDQYSECSHQISTKTKLKLEPMGENRFGLNGSPADCVRLALHTQTNKIDAVCSGINAGGNLGVDVYYSGTVAAAREAVIHGIPAIAFSNYFKREKGIAWEQASLAVSSKINALLSQLSTDNILNINFPWDLSQWENLKWIESHLEASPLQLKFQEHDDGFTYSGVYPERPRQSGSDVDTCFSGNISMSKISLAHF